MVAVAEKDKPPGQPVETWLITEDHYFARLFKAIAPPVRVVDEGAIDHQTTRPDLIFVDVYHGKKELVPFLFDLRKRYPHSSQIVLAAAPYPEEARSVLKTTNNGPAANDYLTKTYNPTTIKRDLDLILAKVEKKSRTQ